jgi:alkylated DNA nucleotide flippase Atl1
MEPNRAQARLARAIAEALSKFADEVEDAEEVVVVRTAEDTADPADEYNLGKRQRQIVDLPGLVCEAGLRTSEIASAIDYEVPNTYSTLQALARSRIVEQVPNKEPQHWRLARRYRPNAEAFMRMAGHVREGEWTTYGDISIAVMGDHRGARGVGRAAAAVADFPNPHRVLMQGGRISPDWKSAEGLGPEECLRRLNEDGVIFEDGLADPTRRVTWDELMQRDAAASID